MKISIIDIGTQSIKHSIFEVDGAHKKIYYYKRFSDANLGENTIISAETTQRCLNLLGECIALNAKEGVTRQKIVGTDILRKASNASEFVEAVNNLFRIKLHVISQHDEARYLFEGFLEIVPQKFKFAVTNIGGGSTEIVVGEKGEMKNDLKLPFGVKFLRNTFSPNGFIDWEHIDEYLFKEIHFTQRAPVLFVTGVLDFITAVNGFLGLLFEKSTISDHPLQMTLDAYRSFVMKLRTAPIEELKRYYTKDPHFCNNTAIGQSVYLAIADKLGVVTVIPSNNDLIDGVVYELIGQKSSIY